MELLHLKYVVAIAESESMTKAADQLHVSQSALSLSYRRLEEELGVKLFRREGRTLQLTEPGRHFCAKATEILKKAAELSNDMLQWHEAEISSVAYSSEAGDFTNEAKMLYNAFFPERQLVEFRDNSRDTLRQLRSGSIAFAVTCCDCTEDELVSQKIMTESMYAFVNEHSPLSRMDRIRLEQLSAFPLITQREDYSISRVMMGFFETAGIPIGRRHYVGDPESMALTVYNGLGNTFIPETIVNLWRRAPFAMAPCTRMIPVEEPFCQRTLYLTWNLSTPRTPLADHYMEFLRHFGRLAQRIRNIPNPMEMETYTKKYWSEFCPGRSTGPNPTFVGAGATDA